MEKIQELFTKKNVKVLLLGYGREGQSTHRYLHQHVPNAEVGIADQNPIDSLFPVKSIHTGKSYLDAVKQYDVIIRTPSISSEVKQLEQARASGKIVTSEMELFFSQIPGIHIGVTGTKGKSTTAALIHHFLTQKYPDVRLIGNIGKPALDFVEGANDQTVFVIELSSYQLEDVHYSPHYAVLLGIHEEHLDHHGTFEKYLQAKSHIFSAQTSKDFLIYDADNATTQKLVSSAQAQLFPFSTSQQKGMTTYIDHEQIFFSKNNHLPQLLLELSDIPLLGQGNITNTLAAVTVAGLMDVSPTQLHHALKSFHPLPHRLEFVGENQGIQFYDDSIATIPTATINAIDALQGKVETLIAGGFDRGINYDHFGKYLATHHINNLVLFNPSGERIAAAVEKYRKTNSPQMFEVETMEQAIHIALQHTHPGKVCLLSPASASYGRFKDYIERGNKFREILGFSPSQMK